MNRRQIVLILVTWLSACYLLGSIKFLASTMSYVPPPRGVSETWTSNQIHLGQQDYPVGSSFGLSSHVDANGTLTLRSK